MVAASAEPTARYKPDAASHNVEHFNRDVGRGREHDLESDF
jgi:hypothetical protein